MQRIKPITGEIYHVYNRGVEKRKTFLKDSDYIRFVHDLFEFNDISPAPNLSYHLGRPSEVGLPNMPRPPRKLLVELLAFCLMPNHFHLLLRQRVDGGTTEFMRKLGTGYTNYFNLKYERVGPLFQGKYKYVHVTHDSYLFYLLHYLHCNALDLHTPGWRNGKIKNLTSARKFLEAYRWSSYGDYIGKKNFPVVTQREFLQELKGGTSYRNEIAQWLVDMHMEGIRGLTLE